MSDHNFPVILSHCALAGTGIYGLIQIKNEHIFYLHITFGLLIINNILAIHRYLSSNNYRLQDMYRFTAYSQALFVLPCINTALWLANGYSKEWCLAWVAPSIFALLCYLIYDEIDLPFADLIITFNLVGLGLVSVLKEIQYGVAATVAYAIAYCYMKNLAVYNYGLCVFAYCALRCMGFSHDII